MNSNLKINYSFWWQCIFKNIFSINKLIPEWTVVTWIKP